MRQQLLDRYQLLNRFMAAIVDYDVDTRYLRLQALQEISISLVADEHRYPIVLVNSTGVLNIHSINMTLFAKIFPPHLKAAATINADLEYVHLLSSELLKMAVIDIEIVIPLKNTVTGGHSLEIGAEWIREIGSCNRLSPRSSGVGMEVSAPKPGQAGDNLKHQPQISQRPNTASG
jgi:hypothetical protein